MRKGVADFLRRDRIVDKIAIQILGHKTGSVFDRDSIPSGRELADAKDASASPEFGHTFGYIGSKMFPFHGARGGT